MTSIDYTDPRQVFNRLAQIQHDTAKRIRTIDVLTEAQAQADREYDQLERIALAYLAPKDYPIVTAMAYDEEHYVRHSVDYCLTIINSSVLVKPHLDACNIGDLTEDEIQTALKCPERGRTNTSRQE
ncbi:MAG: hypothetical protein ABSH35_35110 [Isosphaeraceae bacterium]|jgi:hypothetical protein